MNKGIHWQVTAYEMRLGTHYTEGPFSILFRGRENKEGDLKYWAGQLETCPETQRVHMHVHLCFKQDKRPGQVRDWLAEAGWAGAHVEKARNARDSLKYVTKEETRLQGPFRSAECPAPNEAVAGRRNDLEGPIAMIREGHAMEAVAQEHAEAFVRFHRGLYALANEITAAPMRPNMDTICLYGPPGTGKSTIAARLAERLFPGEVPFYKPAGPWWSGYRQHKVVMLDDYAGKGQALQEVKNSLDKFPCTVQIKCGSVHLHTELAIITSNTCPRDWYDEAGQADREAVLRRMLIWEIPNRLWGSEEGVREAERLEAEICEAYRRHDPNDRRRGWNSCAFVYPIFVRPQDRIAPVEQPQNEVIYLSESD